MIEPRSLSSLRKNDWADIPSSPGMYWWYFPQASLDQLPINNLCEGAKLQLRSATEGNVCLYIGLANNLAQRIKWHAAQKLTMTSLRSGFLSTFRFSLLALNDFDYLAGAHQINGYFDSLAVRGQATATRREAMALEHRQLQGIYHYPLNIRGNGRRELAAFISYLKSARKAYKHRYLL